MSPYTTPSAARTRNGRRDPGRRVTAAVSCKVRDSESAVLPSDLFVDSSGAATPDRSLRIALAAPYDLARAGGVASHIRAQARALVARGHVACIFGPASAPID